MNYLLVVRASQEKAIFRNNRDYAYFFRLVLTVQRHFEIKIFGFCFMPECAKLVVQMKPTIAPKDPLSYLTKNYKMHLINLIRDNSKDVCVDAPIRLKDSSSFLDEIKRIEFEPVQAGFVLSPAHYRYSSAFHRALSHPDEIKEISHIPGEVTAHCGLN